MRVLSEACDKASGEEQHSSCAESMLCHTHLQSISPVKHVPIGWFLARKAQRRVPPPTKLIVIFVSAGAERITNTRIQKPIAFGPALSEAWFTRCFQVNNHRWPCRGPNGHKIWCNSWNLKLAGLFIGWELSVLLWLVTFMFRLGELNYYVSRLPSCHPTRVLDRSEFVD